MYALSNMFRSSLIATLLLVGAATVARGQVPAGGTSFGGSSRGMVTIMGTVVCAGCSLEEAQAAQPREPRLYLLTHRKGQVVIKVTAVDESSMFEVLALPPRLWVRGADNLLDRLNAEENLFKDISIVGLLHNTRTFDVFNVSVQG